METNNSVLLNQNIALSKEGLKHWISVLFETLNGILLIFIMLCVISTFIGHFFRNIGNHNQSPAHMLAIFESLECRVFTRIYWTDIKQSLTDINPLDIDLVMIYKYTKVIFSFLIYILQFSNERCHLKTKRSNPIFQWFQISRIKWRHDIKVVLYNIDVTAMCSVAKCKQSCLIDHLLHS